MLDTDLIGKILQIKIIAASWELEGSWRLRFAVAAVIKSGGGEVNRFGFVGEIVIRRRYYNRINRTARRKSAKKCGHRQLER